MLGFGHWRTVAGLLKQKAVKAQEVSLSLSYLQWWEAWHMEKKDSGAIIPKLYISVHISFTNFGMLCVLLPTAVIKYPDRSNPRERGLNLAYSSICRPLWCGSQGSSRFRSLVTFHSQSGNRKRLKEAHVQTTFWMLANPVFFAPGNGPIGN